MKKRRGMTLIEIIMAMVIAAIIIYPMLNIFIGSLSKNPAVEAVDIGLNLAQSKIEEVSSRSFGNIANEGPTSFGGNFTDYNYQVEVHYVSSAEPNTVVDPTVTSYKQVIVRVISGNLPAGSIVLKTLVTDASNE